MQELENCCWRTVKLGPILVASSLWAWRNLYRAKSVLTQDLGFSSHIREIAPLSRLLRKPRLVRICSDLDPPLTFPRTGTLIGIFGGNRVLGTTRNLYICLVFMVTCLSCGWNLICARFCWKYDPPFLSSNVVLFNIWSIFHKKKKLTRDECPNVSVINSVYTNYYDNVLY